MEPEAPQVEEVTLPKKRGRKPKIAVTTAAQDTMTVADVMNLIPGIIEAARKPSEYDQAKLDKERAKEIERARVRADMARTLDMAKARSWLSCTHSRYNPATHVSVHLWRAQVHSPRGVKPYFIPMCQECQHQLPRITASQDMLTDGVQLDKRPTVDKESLLEWSLQTGHAKEVKEYNDKMNALANWIREQDAQPIGA